jgi:F-type H+-transporting ATPase subunit delta
MARIAHPYAAAIFDLAKERGQTDLFAEQAGFLADSLADEDFGAFLAHPGITIAEKEKAVTTAFGGKVADELIGLMILLLRKGHGQEIKETLETFLQRIREDKRILSARVRSAVPLTDAQLSTLRTKLASKSQKEVELTAEVEPSLIGGLQIYADGLVIDGAIRTRLENLRKRLVV